jgi:hypothetical protein
MLFSNNKNNNNKEEEGKIIHPNKDECALFSVVV